MLDPAVMWIIGAILLLLPLVLTLALNGTNQSDVRVSRRWRGKSLL